MATFSLQLVVFLLCTCIPGVSVHPNFLSVKNTSVKVKARHSSEPLNRFYSVTTDSRGKCWVSFWFTQRCLGVLKGNESIGRESRDSSKKLQRPGQWKGDQASCIYLLAGYYWSQDSILPQRLEDWAPILPDNSISKEWLSDSWNRLFWAVGSTCAYWRDRGRNHNCKCSMKRRSGTYLQV